MSEEERLSVRLSSDDLILLKELVYLGRFSSEADAVNESVHALLNAQFSEEEKSTILNREKNRKKPDLSVFTSNGSDARVTLNNIIAHGLDKNEGDD